MNLNVTCGQGAEICELILNFTVYCLLNICSLDRHSNLDTERACVLRMCIEGWFSRHPSLIVCRAG